jgi:hypothetical protein
MPAEKKKHKTMNASFTIEYRFVDIEQTIEVVDEKLQFVIDDSLRIEIDQEKQLCECYSDRARSMAFPIEIQCCKADR